MASASTSAPVAPTASQVAPTQAAFNYSNNNYAMPTLNTTPVTTDTPAAVALIGSKPMIANPAYDATAAKASQDAIDAYNAQSMDDGMGFGDFGFGFGSLGGSGAPAAYNVPQQIEGPAVQGPTISKPIANPGTNSGYLSPEQAYNTTSPSQSSYNWGSQTAGTGSTPSPVSPQAAQAWGTGNGTAQASFDPSAFTAWLLSPETQAGFAGMATKRQ